MKVVGDFNNISKELRPVLPKKGTVVKYQFLIGQPDFENPKKLNYPPSFRVPTKDRIYDPGQNDFVDIGVTPIKQKDKEGNETYRTKAFYLRGGQGLLALTIGKIEDDEMFEFLELSNLNRSNDGRDTSVLPLFYKIDETKDAADRKKVRDKLTSALVYVSNMKDAEKRAFAAGMAWNEQAEIEMIEDQIGEYARAYPGKFIEFVDSPQLADKSMIKLGITKGIIKYDVATHKILWGDTENTIAILERKDGTTYVDNFFDWMKNSKGNTIMDSIRKRVNKDIADSAKKPEPTE